MGKRKAERSKDSHVKELSLLPATEGFDSDFMCMYFPSGFNPTKEKSKTSWEAFSDEHRRSHACVGKTGHNVTFVGTTDQSLPSAPCRYVLGEFDKKSRELKISPIIGNSVIRMEPRIKGLEYSNNKDHSSGTPREDAEERAIMARRLVEAFGSQRRLRQMRAAQASRVHADQVSGADTIMNLVSTATLASPTGVLTREQILAAALSQRAIPPHNPSATTASEAYTYSDLVPASIRHSLDPKGLNVFKSPKESSRVGGGAGGTKWGRYVASRVVQRASILTEEQLKMGSLLGHLLTLYTRFGTSVRGINYHDIASKTGIENESVAEGIMDLFYQCSSDLFDPHEAEEEGGGGEVENSKKSKTWVLSKEKKNLMLGWILILALRIEDCAVLEAVHFERLADELKLRPGELVGRYRELGCTDVRCKVQTESGSMRQSYKICLLPPSSEEKKLSDYFPAFKMGLGRGRR